MDYESVGIIAQERRTGSPSQLFFLWFSSNMQLTTIVTGALAASLHMNITSALVGIIAGNLIGGSIMGLHAAQGPRMPSPQMILSRAQFGIRGSFITVIVFSMMYIGFVASTTVIGGKLLTQVTHIPYTLSLLCLNAIVAVLVFYGNSAIQQFQRIAAYLFLFVFLYLSISIAMHSSGIQAAVHPEHFSIPKALVMASIAVTWQISYTPYVSDYSRHLSEGTPVWRPLLFTVLGTCLSSTWMMSMGALTASTGIRESDISNGTFLLTYVPESWQWLVYALLVVGILAVNVFNLYGGYMSTLSLLLPPQNTVNTANGLSKMKRIVLLGILTILCSAISVLGSGNFLMKYQTFLSMLLYFLIPWSAISLTDFYVVRRGQYDPEGLLGVRSTYRVYNVPTLTIYGLTVLSEFALLQSTGLGVWHQLVWLEGFVVSSLLYYAVYRASLPFTALKS